MIKFTHWVRRLAGTLAAALALLPAFSVRAQAADPGSAPPAARSTIRLGFSLGVDTVTNDPYFLRVGPRVGLSVAVRPWLAFSASGSYFPVLTAGSLDDPNLKPGGIFPRCYCSYDASLVDAEIQATARFRLLSYQPGDWTLGLGVTAGVALVHTLDDEYGMAEASAQAGYPEFDATRSEFHPGPLAGVYWSLQHENLGLRVRFDQIHYLETVESNLVWTHTPTILGLDGVLWF